MIPIPMEENNLAVYISVLNFSLFALYFFLFILEVENGSRFELSKLGRKVSRMEM